MTGITDVIVAFLFFPVTFFIIVPLVMLLCYLLYKLFALWRQRTLPGKQENSIFATNLQEKF